MKYYKKQRNRKVKHLSSKESIVLEDGDYNEV